MLVEFGRAIRRHKTFANAFLIFCCEKNMAHEAGFLAEKHIEQNRLKNIAMRQNENNDYGWHTNNENKVKSAYKVT